MPLIIDTVVVHIPPIGVRNPIPAILQDFPPCDQQPAHQLTLFVCQGPHDLPNQLNLCLQREKGTDQWRLRSPGKPDSRSTSNILRADCRDSLLCTLLTSEARRDLYIMPSPSRYAADESIPAICRGQVGSGVRFAADSRCYE